MIGVTDPLVADGGRVEARVVSTGVSTGGWGPWFELHGHNGDTSTEPTWVGSASGYEVRSASPAELVKVHLVRDPGGDRRTGPEMLEEQGRRATATDGPTPPIVRRSSWGAKPPVTTVYYDTIRLGVVHHTVNANTYAPQDVPGILRSIQSYHMDVQGWWDIAYTFLVDRFGTMWEGRAGGIDESFEGGHTKGFNRETFAIGNLGDFTSTEPTSSMLNANAELMAWKLKRYGVDANAITTIAASGEGNEWYRPGDIATFPTIIGHRDTRPTECPGQRLYRWLPWMRAEAHARQPKYTVKPIPTTAAAATGPLARNRDGRLELFAIGLDSELKHIWQWPTPTSGWSALASLGGSFPAKPISVIANEDGRLEVFLAGNDGQTHHLWQSPGAPSGWSDTYALGGLAGGAPVAGRNQDGRLQVFAVSSTGQLWHAWQVAPNSGWSPPAVLGTGFAGDPAVGTTAEGKLFTTAVATDGTLRITTQTQPGGAFGPIVSIGSGAQGRPCVGRNADGRLEVFVLGTDNRVWHSFQSGYMMSPLYQLGSATFSQPPAVATNADGRLEVFAVGTDNRLWHIYQVSPNSSWSGWEPIGDRTHAGPPTVVPNADGRLEVFLLGSDHTIWHIFQVAPNSAWSDFYPLAGNLVT